MFENILGNENIKKYLINCIRNNNISHSYIFSGIKGIGKYLFAKEFAKRILKDELMQDFYEIKPGGKSIKISQIRDLQNVINIKPVSSEKAVYIIDDADLMTAEAQNSLLKILEEPPKYVVIILIVNNNKNVLSTVKSRCVNVEFGKLSNEEIKKFLLINGFEFSNKDIDIFKVLNGSLSNIDLIVDDYDDLLKLSTFISVLRSKNIVNIYKSADFLYNNDKIIRLLEYLNILLFDNSYFDLIEIVEKVKNKILMNNNMEMSIDYMIINFIDFL